jgi:hypothetical protein
MNNLFLAIPSAWLEWVAIVSYITFAAFITWRVFSK